MVKIETPPFPLQKQKKEKETLIKVIVCIIHTILHIICSNKKELSRVSFYRGFL